MSYLCRRSRGHFDAPHTVVNTTGVELRRSQQQQAGSHCHRSQQQAGSQHHSSEKHQHQQQGGCPHHCSQQQKINKLASTARKKLAATDITRNNSNKIWQPPPLITTLATTSRQPPPLLTTTATTTTSRQPALATTASTRWQALKVPLSANTAIDPNLKTPCLKSAAEEKHRSCGCLE
jgi:hypothetical protein